jgi:hypothetical protein
MSDEEELVAYCGLYCGGCFSYQGKVADLARDLRKELRSSRFDKTAESLSKLSFFKTFEDYPQCYEVLGAMVKLRCRKGCRNGGGNPTCAIKVCCNRKGYEGCWECGEFAECKKMEFLKTNHGDAHIKNLRNINKKGIRGFLEGKKLWYSKMKNK